MEIPWVIITMYMGNAADFTPFVKYIDAQRKLASNPDVAESFKEKSSAAEARISAAPTSYKYWKGKSPQRLYGDFPFICSTINT